MQRRGYQLAALALVLALLIKAGYFFYRFPQFYLFWDYLGHVQEAAQTSWPWTGGWSNTYWGGYPILNYPPLTRWALKGLGAIFSHVSHQLIVYNLVVLGLLGHSLFLLAKRVIKNRTQQLMAMTLTIGLFVISPINALVTLSGFLFSGTIAASLGLPLLLYFLASKDWVTRGWLWGLLLLTHTLTASLAALYFFIDFVFIIFEKKQGASKKWLYSFLLGTTIGLSWILPFLDPNLTHASFNTAGRFFTFSLAFSILLAVTLIIQSVTKNKPSRIAIFALIIGLISMMPFQLAKFLENHVVRGIHFYRYYPFLFILTPLAFFGVEHKWLKPLWSRISPKVAQVTVLLALGTILLIPLSPLRYQFLLYPQKLPTDVQGRVMDVANEKEVDLFVRTADHVLTDLTSLEGSVGLFFESASDSLVYGLAKYKLNPESFSVPVYTLYVEELGQNISNTQQLTDWLGITHQAFVSENETEPDAVTFGEINISRPGFTHHRYFHLQEISQTQLVETLDQPVTVQADLDLGEWWAKEEKQLIVKEEFERSPNLNLDKPAVGDIKTSQQEISFEVSGEKAAPILVKYSYSPYWQAKGDTTQPVWVTPGNMLLYGKGKIDLQWQLPNNIRLFAPLSLLTLVITTAYLAQREMSRLSRT